MKPGDELGKYRLEALIGRGGGGDVYLATQGGLGGFSRLVAIKILHGAADARHDREISEISTETFDKLAREARIIGLLQQRNIVQVHEVAEARGIAFLVMEYVEGVTLKKLIRSMAESMPLWLGVHLGVEVCRALQYAHLAEDDRGRPLGIAHRDIKPSNVLLSVQGDVKLSDFGLAKAALVKADQLTAHGVIKGTPAYMSPEQRAGLPATACSDVFSLAMVVYEACTGRRPEVGRGGVSLPPLSRLDPLVPRGLDPMLRNALDKDPGRRPTASELAVVLEQTLGSVTPSERLSRLGQETAIWVRRVQKGLRRVDSGDLTRQAEPTPGSLRGGARGSFSADSVRPDPATEPGLSVLVADGGATAVARRPAAKRDPLEEVPTRRVSAEVLAPFPAEPEVPAGIPVVDSRRIGELGEIDARQQPLVTGEAELGSELEYAHRAQRTYRRIFGLVLFALVLMVLAVLWLEGEFDLPELRGQPNGTPSQSLSPAVAPVSAGEDAALPADGISDCAHPGRSR